MALNVLGICGRDRDAASALLTNGALVAAVAEESCVRTPGVGYAHSGGFPFASVEACLRRAGLAADRVDRIVFCGSGDGDGDLHSDTAPWRARVRRHATWARPLAEASAMTVERLDAHASQLLVLPEAEGHVLVLDAEGRGAAAVFARAGRALELERKIDHFSRLLHVVQRAAVALGEAGDPLPALQRLSADGQPVYLPALARALWYVPGGGLESDREALATAVADAEADAADSLSDAAALHVKVRYARANFAASVMTLLGEIVCEMAEDASEAFAPGAVGFGGSLFAHHAVMSALRSSLGARAQLAPVPGSIGLAIGAAIAGANGSPVSLPAGLAVGREFSEQDVKDALDGAHLDYVYEPARDRLLARAARLLSRGKLVGWFHGPMEFASQSLGARSILCDPSSRYSRENVNRYLRQRPDDLPPPLVMTAEAAAICLEQPVSSPYGVTSARVRPAFRPRLQAAVTDAGQCRVQTLAPGAAPPLVELLDVFQKMTDIPALLHVDLCGPAEPVACTPRDALRTVYSTPVDALFIERFVLMKDYWLLRSGEDA